MIRQRSLAGFAQWLNDTSTAGPIILLAGSAVSLFEPSGLPAGQAVTDALAGLLGNEVPKAAIVRDCIRSSAFEHVMQACPRHDELRAAVAGLYHCRIPNPVHEAIATLVEAGAVAHVITTNYDLCLDVALGDSLRRVVTKNDLSQRRGGEPTYFKIHGCSDRPDTLVFTMSAEHRMNDWKRDLLREMVAGHRIVVLGYSGRDFEICPELVRLKRPLAWVNRDGFKDEYPYWPSPGAMPVLRLPETVAVQADFCDVLEQLGARRPTVKVASVAVALDVFRFGATPEDRTRNLDLWRCELFRHIGCARAAHVAARRLRRTAVTPDDRAKAAHYLGLAAFHAGRYRICAKKYRVAASMSPHDSIGYLLDAVIADRCLGNRALGRRTLGGLSARAPQLRPQILLRELEFDADDYEDAKEDQRMAEAESIRQRALPRLRELAGSSDTPGATIEHQQTDQLANRLDLATELKAVDYAPATGREGFAQIGYLVAMASSIRAELLRGAPTVPLDDAVAIFLTLDALGARAEAWKLGLAVARATRGRRRTHLLLTAVKNYLGCQYTLAARRRLLRRLRVGFRRAP